MENDGLNSNLRLFLAITPPQEVQACLIEGCRGLQPYLPRLRWNSLDHYHITLRFLGETAAEELPLIKQTMTEVAAEWPPMALELAGWGGFPNPHKARVVWVGLAGEGLDNLQLLADNLANRFPTNEKKPFVSHITVARAPAAPLSLPEGWQERVPLPRQGWLAGEIHLYQSTLTPWGSRYRILDTATFSHHS